MSKITARERPAAGSRFIRHVLIDLAVVAGIVAVAVVAATQFNLFGQLQSLAARNATLNQVFGALFVAGLGLAAYGLIRSQSHMGELKRRLKAEEQTENAAMHDQLTGLPNRRHLKGVLNFHLAQTGDARRMAVIAVNLDRFKSVNDMHGRAVGDELLASVGQLLNMRAGVDGFAARLGGDDFAVVLLGQSEEFVMDWVTAAITAIEMPFKLTNVTTDVGVTMGVAFGPSDGAEAETLLHRADVAMRRAKEKSRGWFAFFKNGMDDRVHDRAIFEHDLWVAVRDDLIEPWYQPLVQLKDGKVTGYEILARWTHRERGLLMPDQFIPAAEGAAVIGEMTLNLLRKACNEAATWHDGSILSINISPQMLQDPKLPKHIFRVLAEANFPPERLEVELTETALVADFDAARAIFAQLKAKGVKIAIDNFGVGNTSLRQLRELPFDKLKLDRSFVETMTDDRESALMVRSIIVLAEGFGLDVVAEGVEKQDQADALIALGCAVGQGHHFGKAAPADERKAAVPSKADEKERAEKAAKVAARKLEAVS